MTTRSQIVKPTVKRSAHPLAAQPVVKPAATTAGKKTTPAESVVRKLQIVKIGQSLAWYKMDFADKIHVIRSGVPANRVGELSSAMNMPKEALMEALGLPRATINRKVQRDQTLSPQESERVMGMQALIGQVEDMIDAERHPEFDAAKWLATWLAAPLPALGGATPASFMDTVEGQKYVGNLLEMAQSGAYA